MPAFIVNSTAIAINKKNIIEGESPYDRIDSFFEKIKYVLDNCFNEVDPQLLNFTIDANGDVIVDSDYLDLLPAKDHKMINELHKAMKNRFINAIESDIWYEGPDNWTNFDEVFSEEDSPYESPIFTSEDLYSIGLNFESTYDFDDLAPLCQKALEHLGDDYSIELVDYQGTYEYFEPLPNEMTKAQIPDVSEQTEDHIDKIMEKTSDDWTEEDINEIIKHKNYGKGSKEGDDLILKIVSHQNIWDGWLEDFALTGLHTTEVVKHIAKNPKVDSWLLEELYERKKIAEWKEVNQLVLKHKNCPDSLKP